MYAQVCTRLDLSFVVTVLSRFQANSGIAHSEAAKKVIMYLKRTRDFMLVYSHMENLEMVAYCDVDLAGCVDDRRLTSGYTLCWLMEQCHGRARNSQQLPLLQWRQSSLHDILQPSMKYG